MTDTTLARLSPRAPDEPASDTRRGEAGARPAGAARARAASSAIGIVARRGIQVFAVAALVFVVFALWLSGLAHARSQIGLQRRFRSELSSNSAPVGGAIPAGAPVAIIADPEHRRVRSRGRRARAAASCARAPATCSGHHCRVSRATRCIAGRRTLYGGPFRHLGSLRPGDRIHVTTGEANTTYRVTSVKRPRRSDGSFVQDHGDNRLTLFTTDSRWTATGRLVVTATLVGNPYPPTNTQRPLDADGLGLTGERNGAPNMLVWLELLAVAGLFAAYAASRWSAPRVWLVFAPVSR